MSAAGAEPGAETAPLLTVRVDRKVYRKRGRKAGTEAVEAVRGLAFELHAGEITCLIGPSGAGKTTTLRILLGLDRDFEGSVTPEPSEAGIAMVFQDPRLLPWRTIEQNVRLGLPRERRARDLDGLFASLGLASWRAHYPGALSLGMQRRVALARALALEPRILVLDEPFVSLDDAAAASLRALVVEAVADSGTSALMVTHNVAEAIEIADRLLLVSPRPARLLADLPLDRPRCERDRAWADATRQGLAARFPGIVAQ
ncbi:UNVERIFIED_ORG: NitT/TauT family transport system ATP-binding protein [Methylobacterium sp. SuP10 SLI 274]|uniref:ABC transporter ATP-binding protein n=1 Tax=Methylorubrum extorquens TaxID=408 RepID=UPI0020A1B4A9|nr:ATP-binding cassette domain-containing protein [Methylorubrum extorquens]MDF9865911.1 NitT/TauT family transport system ATP-binding protein [Methylorubrum pseudosasae]MDH6639465.1 NitT/TauT family transport system ATP-binding protein [Methylobacterium sp. SuP10 SLI 274]MDH6668656.1 NitT/TauT family transport system ATP-binding protein [Methylorubrum zatmanii]MCP1560540.1 NitT/TauT family transport system ATP-binding protein [Methylorubrum extorquens]MDF9794210.1 NitT/TauT family transport s